MTPRMRSWKIRRKEGFANAVKQHQRRAKVKRTFTYRLKKWCRTFFGAFAGRY